MQGHRECKQRQSLHAVLNAVLSRHALETYLVENITTGRKSAATPVNSVTQEPRIALQNAEVEGRGTGTAIMRKSTEDQEAKKSSQATEHLNEEAPLEGH